MCSKVQSFFSHHLLTLAKRHVVEVFIVKRVAQLSTCETKYYSAAISQMFIGTTSFRPTLHMFIQYINTRCAYNCQRGSLYASIH